MLIKIKEEHFMKNVHIRFRSINDGFNRFENKTLLPGENELNEERLCDFLLEAFKLNGEENSYVDFYYNVLSNEDKKKFEQLIDSEDKEFLEEFKNKCLDNGIYYRLSEESIPFINKLNCREILFSTIYFTKFPCTIWGNYNKKFPVFYLDSKVLEKYKIIARKSDLNIE